MNLKIKSSYLIVLIICLSVIKSYAAKEKIVNSLTGNAIVATSSPVSLFIEDQKRDFMISNPNWACRFGNKSSNVSVVLRFDDTKRNYDNLNWLLDVTYEIKLYNTSNVPFAVIPSEHAIINYDKNSGTNYSDIFLKTYEGALKAEVKITNVSMTLSSGTVLSSIPAKYNNDIFFDLIQETERYYNLTFNGNNCIQNPLPSPIVTTTLSTVFPNPLTQSLLQTSNNQIPIAWNYIEGAESYDVEWLFVDLANNLTGITPFTTVQDLDFSNATRVNVWEQHYEIPMAYPRGIIVYRVRAIGNDHTSSFSERREGAWSVEGTTTSNLLAASGVSYMQFYEGLDEKYNWQYSATFAEEGKRKEMISYFDGSLRNRQTSTILNSDNNTIVAETKYDHQGRPSVQMLPTPIANTGIHFNSNFNPNFNKEDFDIDGNFTTSGANALVPLNDATSNYYGNNSSANGLDAYIPDAQGVPYVQTRYKTDGTGRIISQSGVGVSHMLGKHDTRYVYGTPTGQAELDRLFGNEVGSILHYKKNAIIDPNGQVSVSYLDQEGRTIATALAGNTPSNLLDIDFKPTATQMVTDILTGKNLIVDDSRVAKTTIVNTAPNTLYTFNYTLNLDTACFKYTLKPDDVPPPMCVLCNTCSFNLDIKITDDEGKNLPISVLTGGSVGFSGTAANCFTNTVGGVNVAIHCTDIQTANYTIGVYLPDVASYHIEKIVTVSNAGIEAATSTFTLAVKEPPCGPFTTSVSPIPCNDCHYICNKMYGVNAPSYVTPLNPQITTDKYGHLLPTTSPLTPTEQALVDNTLLEYNTCYSKCENPIIALPDECALRRMNLIKDMSPGGQYFDNKIDQNNSCVPSVSIGNINDWLNNNVGTISGFWSGLNTFLSTSANSACSALSVSSTNQNFTWLRNNWNDCYASYLIQFHPEYCNYKFYCGETELCHSNNSSTIKTFTTTINGNLTTGSFTSINMKHSNLFDKIMGSDVNRLFSNPMAKISGSSPNSYISNLDPITPAKILSILPAHTSEYYDPLFTSECQKTLNILCSSNLSGSSINTVMLSFLENYYVSHPSSGPSTVPMSIWYVLDDPDGITNKNVGDVIPISSSNSVAFTLDAGTLSFFQSFHNSSTGLLASSGNSKYNVFKSTYNGYKQFVLYGLFSSSYDCRNDNIINSYTPSSNLVSDANDNLYTPCTGYPANTFPHAQIRFPKNDIFEMMLASCPNFSPAVGVVSTFTNNALNNTCQSNCAGFADGWMLKITTRLQACSLSVPTAVLNSLKNDLITICVTGCDGSNPQGQSFVPSTYVGPPAAPASGTNFNDVIHYYLSSYVSGCSSFFPNLNIVHPPSSQYSQSSCSCDNLKSFALNNEIVWNLSDPNLPSVLATTMNNVLEPFNTITSTDVSYWLSTCFASGPPTSTVSLLPPSGNIFPESMICLTSDIPVNDDPCGSAQAQADASYNSEAIEAAAVHEALLKFIYNYKMRCLQNLDIHEEMTSTYSLNEYYYTLYYYDQAGNLIKTVPPEGVHPLPVSTTLGTYPNFNTQNVNLYRQSPLASTSQFVWPYHTMITNYKYNSLNQLTEQTTPDGGTSKFYYDVVGRLVVSQNAKQAAVTTSKVYSYTLYDDLSRIIEVGEISAQSPISQIIAEVPNDLNTWLKNSSNVKKQITRTYYDEEPKEIFPLSGGGYAYSSIESMSLKGIYASKINGYLRNRVSCVTYAENDFNHLSPYNSATNYYDNASHYSYDIHGNVKTLFVENTMLKPFGYDLNKIDYEYDLVSGKVNEVHFNKGKVDQFYHKYNYDADNRITDAYSSRNGLIWEKESKYFYYKHGPLARVEIGDKQVQATDYAYTIQGWIKGINSTTLNNNNDIGKDGFVSGVASNLNSVFANDAYSYSLGYYNNDYVAKNPSIASGFLADNTAMYASSLPNSASPCAGLYNGNISNMSTTIYLQSSGIFVKSPQIKAFRYDQLNRIKTQSTHESIAGNTWGGNVNFGNKYYEDFSYDLNGNILGLNRYDNSSSLMDQLKYLYTPSQTINTSPVLTNPIVYKPDNKLRFVNDNISTTLNTEDIENQSTGNYDYDAIGNLKSDVSEGISNIDWTVYGKIKSITRNFGYYKIVNGVAQYPDNIDFVYDAQGNRIVKVTKPTDAAGQKSASFWKYTYYVRDAQGNVMATYKKENISGLDFLTLDGIQIYGSSRLGVLDKQNKRLDYNSEVVHQSDFSASTNGWNSVGASTAIENYSYRLKVSLPINSYQSGVNLYPNVQQGKTYEVSFDIDITEKGNNVIEAVVIDNTSPSQQVISMTPLNGNNSFRFTALSSNTIVKIQNATATNNAYNFYLDNIIIKEVTTARVLGVKSYELNNHLGNVLTVVSDRKLVVPVNPTTVDHYESEILSSSDYYSFGSPMPGRNYQSSTPYRYGMNGQENDDEITGNHGTHTSAEYWEYDSRLGRRWNRDPVVKSWESPYACFRNNPIYYADPRGLDGKTPIKKGDKVDLGNGDSYVASADEVEISACITCDGKTTGNPLAAATTGNVTATAAKPMPDNRRDWRENNARQGTNGSLFDERGKELLGRWLNGNQKEPFVVKNGKWGEYMKNNDMLKSQIEGILADDALSRDGTDNVVDITAYAEIENGYTTGYEMLHGTESTVGGFQIKGTVKVVNAIQVIYNVTITWNDIIDPNPIYSADKTYSTILETLYTPKDYEVHISWDETLKIER